MNAKFDKLATDAAQTVVRYANSPFLQVALVAGLSWLSFGQVSAQTFTTLYSFGGGTDGASPNAMVLWSNTLYGTTWTGGVSSNGTIFAIKTNGTDFRTLYSFTATSGPSGSNTDGAAPNARLISSSNTLYGTTVYGGSGGAGTVFAIKTDGTGFTNVHTFSAVVNYTNSGGAYPGALIPSGGTLYGTTWGGGSGGNGTVFTVNTDGGGFKTLYDFTGPFIPNSNPPLGSNGDGAHPGNMVLSSNTLYGAASLGGDSGHGAVFKVNSDGTGFARLHSFNGADDGEYPYGDLVVLANTLYGTLWSGEAFAVNVGGTSFTNFPAFASYPVYGGLVLSGDTFYGVGYSNVVAFKTDLTGFTDLYDFNEASDGAGSLGLVVSGNTLYGTTAFGGPSDHGTVFSISFAPQLNITLSAANAILSWPTNYAGFDYTGYTLQATTNLAPPVWTSNLPSPVVVNGRNTVTNPITGTHQFFRLSQ